MQRSRRTSTRGTAGPGRGTQTRRPSGRSGRSSTDRNEGGRGRGSRYEGRAGELVSGSPRGDARAGTDTRRGARGDGVPAASGEAGHRGASFRRGRGQRQDGDSGTVRTRRIRGESIERFKGANDSAPSEDYIVGRHPVLEALKAGRAVNKMLVAEGAEGGSLTEILGKARGAGIVVQRVPRSKLDQIAGPHHQGVILYVSPHDYAELDDIVTRRTGQKPLVVLLDEVEDPYNLGAVLRTAEATGVAGLVIPKRRSVPLTGVVAKVAAGALEHVPVARVTNLVQAIEQLQKEGYWVVGADASATQMYTEVDYAGPTAIVIGAEGKGLSRLVKERCDHLVKLPMLGRLQSLNASVATGVLLYEVVRQRG